MEYPKNIISIWNNLILAFIALDNYLDTKIEDKITDDSYISTLSTTLRPFMVMDNNGKVLYDHGALNLIDSIRVKQLGRGLVDTIFVYTKTFLPEAPLLQFIGAYLYSYESSRISTYCWAYDQRPSDYLGTRNEGKNKPVLENIFTLEILK